MKNIVQSLALPFLILPVLVACESVESTDVLTSGIWAGYTVTSTGSGSTLTEASLKVGGDTSNTFVNLEEDDTLTVTAGGETKTLVEKNLGDIYWYDANFDTEAADTEFVFAFTRTVDDGAPASTVTLPGPFDITAPTTAFIVKRGVDALVVEWTPSATNDSMIVNVNGDCIEPVEEALSSDPGTYTFAAERIVTKEDKESESCEGSVSITRRRTGTLDAAFEEGGRIVAEQNRSVSIRLDP